MELTAEMIANIVSSEIEKQLDPIKDLIENLKFDKEKVALEIFQQQCLSKKTLSISEVAKAQLLGRKYSKKTVKNKLLAYVYKDPASNKDLVITSAVIQYRTANNIV